MPEPRHDDSERIGAAIRATVDRVGAPQGLRERIAAGRPRRAPAGRGRAWLGAAAALGAITVAVLVVVLAWPSSSAEPTVGDATRLALSEATLPAPPVDTTDHRFVLAAIGGVRFPNYAYDSAWRAVGARRDPVAGRPSATVVYRVGAQRVGYTIVDGRPLGIPPAWARSEVDGIPVWSARWDGVTAVVWERGGHTCVLASRTAALPQLLRFVPPVRDDA